MLPSVSKKIDEMSGHKKKKEKKSKKSKKSSKSKKEKKEKKKRKSKKHKNSSSDGESSDEEPRKRGQQEYSDSSDSDTDSEEDAWVEKTDKKDEMPTKREDWLGGLTSITTFSKEAKPEKKNENKSSISYDPAKSVRELNPYWKDGGGGLPKQFSKPKNDSDDEDSYRRQQAVRRSNWKKKTEPVATEAPSTSRRRSVEKSSRRSSSSESSKSDKSPDRSQQQEVTAQREHFLTDHQMNELGAKLVKAELLGNDELVNELKGKLEKAREYRSTHKTEVLSKTFERRNEPKRNKEKEDVLLTATNSKGYSRPVAKSFKDDSDLWGGRSGRKAKKSKPAETHLGGERVRYFADDDKYDIKQMVRYHGILSSPEILIFFF